MVKAMTDTTSTSSTAVFAGETEQRLVVAFLVMLKTARLIERDNATYVQRLDELHELLGRVQESAEAVTIKCHSDYFFVNDRAVQLSDDKLSSVIPILEDWIRLRLGGFTFAKGVSRDELGQVIAEISRLRAAGETREELAEILFNLGVSNVELLELPDPDDDETPQTPEEALKARRQWLRKTARAAFFRSMDTVKSVMQRASESDDIDEARTRRVVQSLIDQIMLDESSLLELTSLRDYDDYTYAHSTNVSIYSLTIGLRLGLDRSRMSQLGFGALFHDMGKVQLPRDLIKKPDSFDDNDWIQMQRHPVLGAKTILRNLDLNPHTARAARVAFEHHINTDLTGYPRLHYRRRNTSLLSRIVSIADTFDALTSGRVYIKQTFAPDEVIRKMRYQMTVKFDPLLLKIFTDIIGMYPVGSLVLLSTNQLALVLAHKETDRTRPYVKIVGDQNGIYEHAQWVDLSAAEYVHVDIVKLVDPEKHGLSLSHFVLAD
jgi:HD-GYP domain-containing protein (c-di-GMP phosphodiesterase class II)